LGFKSTSRVPQTRIWHSPWVYNHFCPCAMILHPPPPSTTHTAAATKANSHTHTHRHTRAFPIIKHQTPISAPVFPVIKKPTSYSCTGALPISLFAFAIGFSRLVSDWKLIANELATNCQRQPTANLRPTANVNQLPTCNQLPTSTAAPQTNPLNPLNPEPQLPPNRKQQSTTIGPQQTANQQHRNSNRSNRSNRSNHPPTQRPRARTHAP
jgi:hypothetical protein